MHEVTCKIHMILFVIQKKKKKKNKNLNGRLFLNLKNRKVVYSLLISKAYYLKYFIEM
jgi:flagellar assembly factor FliW